MIVQLEQGRKSYVQLLLGTQQTLHTVAVSLPPLPRGGMRGKWLIYNKTPHPLSLLFVFGHTTCLWDLSSQTRDQTVPPALEVRSPNHWTPREFLPLPSFAFLLLGFHGGLLICVVGSHSAPLGHHRRWGASAAGGPEPPRSPAFILPGDPGEMIPCSSPSKVL